MTPKGELFRCIECGDNVDHLHEIFYGRFRKLAVKYNLQVPVCICSHPWRIHHMGDGEYWRRRFCLKLKLDHDRILLSLNTRDFDYLEKVSHKMKIFLDSMKV